MSASSVDSSWTCASPASTWTCQHAPLAPGETATPVGFEYRASAVTPGDVLDFAAQLAPDAHEASLTNNAAQGSVQVIAPAVIRGTVWLDANIDGQRQPGEPPVSSETPGLISVSPRSNPDGSGSPRAVAVVQADGTYSMTVEPGNFAVLVKVEAQTFTFTFPNVGDDATDSDIDNVEGDPLVTAGLTDVVGLASGDDLVVDVGLAPAS